MSSSSVSSFLTIPIIEKPDSVCKPLTAEVLRAPCGGTGQLGKDSEERNRQPSRSPQTSDVGEGETRRSFVSSYTRYSPNGETAYVLIGTLLFTCHDATHTLCTPATFSWHWLCGPPWGGCTLLTSPFLLAILVVTHLHQ